MLTAEAKAAKVEELKAKIVQRRAERQEQEKQHDKQSEIQRREMGKQMTAAREEYDKIQRDREYAKRKKEKEDYRRERERLRAELAKDKAERMARGGKVQGGIGESKTQPAVESTAPSAPKEPTPQLSPKEQMISSVEKLKKYRVGNDGLTAVKTLNVYVKNLLEKPDEEKFRSINLSNAAFKKRAGSLVGEVAFLQAIGYQKSDDTLHMALEDRDNDFLRQAQDTLTRAITELSQ